MEQYDFTDTGNAKDIYGLLDCMSEKELEMAREAVRNIRETMRGSTTPFFPSSRNMPR